MASSDRDTRWLIRRGQVWWVNLAIPRKLWNRFGTKRRASLRTTDLREAQKRRHEYIALWQREFSQALKELRQEGNGATGSKYDRYRQRLREALRQASSDDERDLIIERFVDDLERRGPVAETSPEARAVRDERADEKSATQLVEEFLAKSTYKNKETHFNYRLAVRRLVAFLEEDIPIEQVTRAQAVRFVEEGMPGLSSASKYKSVSCLSKLHRHSQRHSEDPRPNPFKELTSPNSKDAQSYQRFTDGELAALLDHSNEELRNLLLMAMYTGMRRSELLTADREVVQGVDCWVIREGKTESAARRVPVHSAIADLSLKRDITPRALTARFRAAAHRAKVKTDRTKSLHSLRGGFVTKLEQAGVPELVTARLVGHRSGMTMSYGLYSGGQDVQALRDAVAKVQYEGLP